MDIIIIIIGIVCCNHNYFNQTSKKLHMLYRLLDIFYLFSTILWLFISHDSFYVQPFDLLFQS